MGKQKKREKWNSALYKNCFIYNRGGVAYISIKDERTSSTKMKFTPKNKPILIGILEKAVEDYLNPKAEEITVTKHTVNSLRKEFLSTINKDKNTLERRFRGGFTHFITNDFELCHINEIREHIINNLKKSKLNPNNIQKIMQTLKRLFNYAIEEEYITRNPIKDSMIPKPIATDLLLFSRDEINQLINYFDEENKEFALLIKFISITGTRISETLSIRWCDIDDTKILIHGKDSKERFIPIKPFPELVEILEQMKHFQNRDKLFHWNVPAPAQRILKAGCQKLGFYVEGRGFHSIRKFIENEYVNALGLSSNLVAEFMGHTRIVQEKHYVGRMKTNDFIQKFTQELDEKLL